VLADENRSYVARFLSSLGFQVYTVRAYYSAPVLGKALAFGPADPVDAVQ
jgi:uroporphyrinogen-III synthase